MASVYNTGLNSKRYQCLKVGVNFVTCLSSNKSMMSADIPEQKRVRNLDLDNHG